MEVLDLGCMPLSDGLMTEEQLAEGLEATYPLTAAFCRQCALMQILETVPPEVLFAADYPYYSSFSEALLAHSRKNALELIGRCSLDSGSLVVDLAINDGYLLRNFVAAGVPVLGIDPAPGPAEQAEKIGVPTLCDFFGKDLAKRLRGDGVCANVIIANNVLAHVADTNGFVEGVRMLLADDGVAVIEVPYVRDLVANCEFDTIYHEHLCYFSVTSADKLFRRHGLFLNDLKHLSIHGGSLRLYVGKGENVRQSVRDALAEERAAGIDRYAYYKDFGQAVKQLRDQLQEMLGKLKSHGKTIAAYGAAAKGAILTNYVSANTDVIDFVVDRNVHKHGKYMPGLHIPISATERLLERMPDYVLMLTWNFKDEILRQQNAYRNKGGRFIIPIPKLEIV